MHAERAGGHAIVSKLTAVHVPTKLVISPACCRRYSAKHPNKQTSINDCIACHIQASIDLPDHRYALCLGSQAGVVARCKLQVWCGIPLSDLGSTHQWMPAQQCLCGSKCPPPMQHCSAKQGLALAHAFLLMMCSAVFAAQSDT